MQVASPRRHRSIYRAAACGPSKHPASKKLVISATTVIDKRIHFPSDWALISPEALEPIRRERRVAGRILDIAMPQLSLERWRIDAVIRQLKAASLPQHVARNISANYAISATARHSESADGCNAQRVPIPLRWLRSENRVKAVTGCTNRSPTPPMCSKMRCRKLSQFAGTTRNFRSDSMSDEASTSQCNGGFHAWFKRLHAKPSAPRHSALRPRCHHYG
jgi:hypothetical protein